MSRKGLPWLRPSRPARSSPTKVTIAMPWSTSSRHPVPRRSSHLEAIAIPNAKSTGTATRHETSSSDSSIASSSSGVSQLDTTNLPVASTPSCISLAPISGYCEHALVSGFTFVAGELPHSYSPCLERVTPEVFSRYKKSIRITNCQPLRVKGGRSQHSQAHGARPAQTAKPAA